jgi:hypothetical protein
MRYAEFPVIGRFCACAGRHAPPIISPPSETLFFLAVRRDRPRRAAMSLSQVAAGPSR